MKSILKSVLSLLYYGEIPVDVPGVGYVRWPSRPSCSCRCSRHYIPFSNEFITGKLIITTVLLESVQIHTIVQLSSDTSCNDSYQTRTVDPEYQVTRKEIMCFGWQVAKGMEYLAQKKVRLYRIISLNQPIFSWFTEI